MDEEIRVCNKVAQRRWESLLPAHGWSLSGSKSGTLAKKSAYSLPLKGKQNKTMSFEASIYNGLDLRSGRVL